MQGNLCIIISSEYPSAYTQLNSEVQRDLRTVKKTLTDHTCVDMMIPVVSGRLFARKLAKATLDAITADYATCHIVLNTHGIPGASDLKHEIVKLILDNLSERGTVITQISALLCDGMSLQSTNAVLTENRTWAHKLSQKDASMKVLQEKLNAMTTKIPQNFEIRGFDKAYDPGMHKIEVADVLNRHGGVALPVSTKPYIPLSLNRYAEKILQSIQIVEAYQTSEKSEAQVKAYNVATNVLGLVLADMHEHLLAHLKTNEPLAAEYKPLLLALEHENRASGSTNTLNMNNLAKIYKHWLKENKVYSKERIEVIKTYAEKHEVCLKTDERIEKNADRLSPYLERAMFSKASNSMSAKVPSYDSASVKPHK